MDELAQCYNVLTKLNINNTIDHSREGDEKWFLENEKTVTQFCRKLAAERPLKDIRDEYNYRKKKGIKDFFFSSRGRHTRSYGDWSSDVCSSDLAMVLDIFAQRARTSEGKLQVELAQLTYLLPRLIGQWAHLERLGGGIGTRGPGETQLESDRRVVRRR